MRLNEEILERVEELFDLIDCEDADVDLNLSMDYLRRFLERDIDGWTNYTSTQLAASVSRRLEGIWDLVSDNQKSDADLRRHFSDFIRALERVELREDSIGNDDLAEEEDCDGGSGRPFLAMALLCVAISFLVPEFAFCSVDSTAEALFSKFSSLLSIAAMGGLLWAGFSFVMGKPEARQHLIYAIIGAIVGFGAESIVALIRSLIH